MTKHPDGTSYPARLMFALEEPLRSRVQAAARTLGLPIEEDDAYAGFFIVTVPDPETAYAFGQQSMVSDLREMTK